MTKNRQGQAPEPLKREEFQARFMMRFYDPAYAPESEAITRLEVIAWEAFEQGRKAPITRRAGSRFADPAYETSAQWLDTAARLKAAQRLWKKPQTASRVLIVCGSVQEEARNVARAVVCAVKELRAGRLGRPDRQLKQPRPKSRGAWNLIAGHPRASSH